MSDQASVLITPEILGRKEEHPSPCPKAFLLSGIDLGSARIATSQDSHSKYYLDPEP